MAYLHLIKPYDMENTGRNGAAVSLWFNHCPHRCKGCWNEQTWNRDESLNISNQEVIRNTLGFLSGPLKLNTLSLLGGDPLSPLNINDTVEILEAIKKHSPDLEVLCWTGYRWEVILSNKSLSRILPYIDILIDGRFEEDKKITGRKYGSSNQRVINVSSSLLEGRLVEEEDF